MIVDAEGYSQCKVELHITLRSRKNGIWSDSNLLYLNICFSIKRNMNMFFTDNYQIFYFLSCSPIVNTSSICSNIWITLASLVLVAFDFFKLVTTKNSKTFFQYNFFDLKKVPHVLCLLFIFKIFFCIYKVF